MTWEQPKTIKLYLHPPLANRQITLWPDFKIVSKAVVPPEGQEPDDYGLRFLVGEDCQEPDWLHSTWQVRADGLPMPILETTIDNLILSLEVFCTCDTQPITYMKLTLQNLSPAERTIKMGVMLRSGLDRLLIGMGGDYYASYRPLLAHWDMLKNTWALQGNVLSDGQHSVRFTLPTGATIQWQAQNPGNPWAKNLAALTIPLAGCASEAVYLTMGGDAAAPGALDFDQARANTEQFWQQELAKITRRPALPESLVPMFNSLVCQCLQMLVRTADGEIWPRQGGRYDGVWPVEAMEWLRALDYIGLHECTTFGYRFFLKHQVSEGEDAGRFLGMNSPHWQNETGGVLYGLAGHLLARRDPTMLQLWREPILAAVGFIERLRTQTKDDPQAVGYGLLPEGIGHDWQWKGQYWCFSDSIMYMGLQAIAQALRAYDDEKAQGVEDCAHDYRACLERTLRTVTADQTERDDVYIPNVLGIAESYPPFGPYHGDGPSNLVRAGIIDPKSDLFVRLERFWHKHGWMQHGLTAVMTECLLTQGYFADPWAGYTWYTSFSDLHWFKGWMAREEREKAAETLWAQMRYGMSKEFYMLERYAANDPTFCPWQPNASANGRLIEMLFDFYGER